MADKSVVVCFCAIGTKTPVQMFFIWRSSNNIISTSQLPDGMTCAVSDMTINFTYTAQQTWVFLTMQFSVSRASGDCYSNDMNDVIKPGVYHVGTNVTLNKPSGAYGWGFLLVFASKADHTLQLYVPDGKTGKVYWRSLWEGESGPWISVIGNELASAASASQVNSELS